MKVLDWNEFLKGTLKGKGSAAISIGVFDGIHKGHQYIFNKLKNKNLKHSIIFTFKSNPRLFFQDKSYPGDIFTISQKLETMSLLGIDIVILIDFSSDFSKLSGKDFLFLITENCDVSYLSLGKNFRCGNNGMTSSYEASEILKKKNIMVEIENMTYFENQLISSTLIREAILAGKLNKAQYMLDRVFSLDIAGIPQIIRENTIIIETKNIKQVLPPQGHYVVRIGDSKKVQESTINLNASEIVVPLQRMQNVNFIKFR